MAAVEGLWDQREDLQDEIYSAQQAVDRARARGKSTKDAERELAAKVEALGQQLRSPAHRRGMTQVKLYV